MRTDTYTPAQRQLLRVMSFVKTDKALADMNAMLADYFSKQIDKDLDALWDEGVINESVIAEWGHEHMRASHK